MFHAHYAAFRVFIHHLALPLTRYQRENFLRLGAAFLTRRSLPVRRLARTLAGPFRSHRAADKRLRRFLGNPRLDEPTLDAALAAYLRFLLPRFGSRSFVPVMLDWTFIKGRAILWAQIPYRGRSFPLLAHVQGFPKGNDEVGRTACEQHLLTRLRRSWPADAPEPLLLMDRGFDKGPLLSWLLAQEMHFIVRIQRENRLYDARGRCLNDEYISGEGRPPRGPLHPKAGEMLLFLHVTYYEKERLPLHLAVTAARDRKSGEISEWLLLTNVSEAELARVAEWYRQRMSPEETHRDSKRGYAVSGFALSHLGRLRPDRLQRYLFFVGLMVGFLVLVAETRRESRRWLNERHWGLSLVTFALDLLHTPGLSPWRMARQACASVQLKPLWLPGGDY
jgi:Transposase DDE domain